MQAALPLAPSVQGLSHHAEPDTKHCWPQLLPQHGNSYCFHTLVVPQVKALHPQPSLSHPKTCPPHPPGPSPTLVACQVTAEGYESDLQQLLTWLHSGSPQADVLGVEVTWSAATGEFDDFDTLWTA